MQFWLQLLVVGLLGSVLVIYLLSMIGGYISYPMSSDYAGAHWDTASSMLSMVSPLLLALAAFGLNPRKLRLVPKLVETSFVTVGGLAFTLIVSFLLSMLPLWSLEENYSLVNLIITLLSLAAYVGLLVFVRSTGRWK